MIFATSVYVIDERIERIKVAHGEFWLNFPVAVIPVIPIMPCAMRSLPKILIIERWCYFLTLPYINHVPMRVNF